MKLKRDAKQAARKLTQNLIDQGYHFSGLHEFTDQEGNPAFWRIRLDHPEKRKWIRPLSFNGNEWVLKEPCFPNGKPLFNLMAIEMEPDSSVWIVEGETCVEALSKLGLTVTTSGSSSSAGSADWSSLSGRNIIIWRDKDDAGLRYARDVTAELIKLDCSVKCVDVDKIEFGDDADGADAVDWRKLNPDAIKIDVEGLPLFDLELSNREDTTISSQQGSNQSQLLDQIAASCELFHSPDRNAYATVPINSHYETWPLQSSGFIDWLGGKIFAMQESVPREQTINDFVSSLIGRAKYQGEEHSVFIRLAGANGNIYLDLADKRWGAIEITPDGWSLIEKPPVKFIRPNGMLPLPQPERGGSIDDLAKLVNLSEEDDLKLLVSCLIYYLNPTGPFPIIIIQGEQGSAKSTFGRVIRNLIDPSSAPLRAAPRNEHDLMISAQNGWVLNFDNLSSLSQGMSDALCRLSTGGGFATRTLYTNTEEIILQATRPICLNGITEFATKPDILDRALIFRLSHIPQSMRKEERVFWAEFDEVAPKILGILLDGVSMALKNLSSVKLDELPRMADFAKFATATEEAFGWPNGSFMEAYLRNHEIGLEAGLEADPVAQAILEWDVDSWWGTATELLNILVQHAPESTIRSQYWPKTASALSSKLRRLLPTLREIGISITFERDGRDRSRRRIIRINKIEQTPSASSDPSGNDETILF
jgi:putative DNA primase/helicase